MGLSESKVVADTFSRACLNAENSGRINIANLLSDKKFMKSLREVWAHIPDSTRRSIGRRRQTEGRKQSHGKLSAQKIAVSETLMANVPKWLEKASSFFLDEKINLDLEDSPIAGAYLCLEKLERREGIDLIRARFLKVVFHRLKGELCLPYLRSDDVDEVTRIILNAELVSSDSFSVKSNFVRWADQGAKIDAFCRSIGGSSKNDNAHFGNLFCLPIDCHDEFIRLFGDQDVERIKKRGILDVQGRASLDKLAADVFDVLWRKLTAWLEGQQSLEPFSKRQPPGRVLPTGSANGEPSQIFGTIEDISPDPRSLLHTIHGSAATSSTVAQSRLREPTIRSFDNARIPMSGTGSHNGEISSDVGETVDVHDTLEPVLPVQDLESSLHEQASINMASSDVHDMIQPLIPPQDSASSNRLNHRFQPPQPVQGYGPIHGQASIDMASTDVHDMIQPILPPQAFASANGMNHGFQPPQPVQGYGPIHGQVSIDMASTDAHDMVRPTHSPQVFISSNSQQPQRNDLEMDNLHHMFPSTLRVQASDPVESQTSKRNRFIAPMITETENMYVQDHPHSPFTPVFAM
ncbi:hypothetical protein N7499_003671 [Penicillium canescens]|uniref:Uncharacterized protein n=1 Tax=Penicillium canescens TaxID=5083 RepID=A0AAD6N7X1_PENCN|nr:hypothetical protein N7460_007525 [Penicillium canescens]KAJ6066342.1 hypothetical protein N7444_000095 [Penicillium canescens]KAJ6090957.1 hypothetical protein N7499_003671 [Penicillium canescens]KAJ6175179.1 hypothetical protein N7485_004984 [Penicillium canescens]